MQLNEETRNAFSYENNAAVKKHYANGKNVNELTIALKRK